MAKFQIPTRTASLRYWLFQVPGWAVLYGLGLYFELPMKWTWLVIGFWILKDLALFPFLWHAFDTRPPTQTHPEGVAIEAIEETGYVRIEGELWKVKNLGPPIAKGQRVRLIRSEGHLWFVEGETNPDS